MSVEMGPLVAALAKAQVQFAPVKRDKTVKVKTKSGQEYSFQYAPLDKILEAVRAPLAANGLAIIQMLDDGALVTSLMHESGAIVSGRVDLPETTDIQALGSAITYLRRYAIQAVLGIAAEDDDDGNRGAGNISAPVRRAEVVNTNDGSLIGTVEVGDKASSDFLLRQSDAGPRLGFRLRGDRGGILVETTGDLADQVSAHRDAIVGQTVSVWGVLMERSFTPKGKAEVTYQVLAAERLRAPGIGDLPLHPIATPDAGPEASGALTEADSEAIWSELDRIGA